LYCFVRSPLLGHLVVSRALRAEKTFDALREVIPAPETELDYRDPWQLLVAVILSAQCTDARVNLVTPSLFERFPDASSTAAVESEDVFPLIRSISYPNNKAKHLVGAARRLLQVYDGVVPRTVNELVTLPGVGRKTAQVVASVAYDVPTLAVDTHVFRVANRIGLVKRDATTPEKVERQLKRLLPEDTWGDAHHLLILHGRYTCTARSPSCESCVVAPVCLYAEERQRLPVPVSGLNPAKGTYWCKTRRHYFNEPDLPTDRHGSEQISCPKCGSMNVFISKTGHSAKRVRDFRV